MILIPHAHQDQQSQHCTKLTRLVLDVHSPETGTFKPFSDLSITYNLSHSHPCKKNKFLKAYNHRSWSSINTSPISFKPTIITIKNLVKTSLQPEKNWKPQLVPEIVKNVWNTFQKQSINTKKGGGRAGKHNKEREDHLTLFYKTSSWYTKKKIRRKKMWREREKDKKKDVLGRRDEVEDQITNKQKKGTLRLLTHTHTHKNKHH